VLTGPNRMYSDMSTPALPFSEACERNKAPILEALQPLLPSRGHVLEIGSGTGQHVVHFAPHWPRLTWQPTDQRAQLADLNARIRLEGSSNILPAIELNAEGAWPDRRFAAAYSANTAHIMSWAAVCAMFAGVGRRLPADAAFCLYGPFSVGGSHTAASNAEFDRQLRARDPEMGLRDTEALEELARSNSLRLETRLALPANNQLLVFRSVEAE
jgi:cyclopropane fatty-acyl-phospholipid synthase-like methyltransferase